MVVAKNILVNAQFKYILLLVKYRQKFINSLQESVEDFAKKTDNR
jgi:hypothetical protein